MDFSHTHGITEVGLYAVRYGNLTIWSLAELLAELHGSSVDVDDERAMLKEVLQRQQGVR
jgi:hypothetical protein